MKSTLEKEKRSFLSSHEDAIMPITQRKEEKCKICGGVKKTHIQHEGLEWGPGGYSETKEHPCRCDTEKGSKPAGMHGIASHQEKVMDKVAVDSTAKNYWSTYFKEYGQMWVRDVPRRIKQAMTREIKATKLEGEIVPVAHDVSKDNTLSVEAAFIGKVDGVESKIMVTASFNAEGKMESIDTTRIS